MNREAFKLARDTLRLAVRRYGWRRIYDLTDRSSYSYGPGKFEGEHWSIVHWYDAVMNGMADEPLYTDGETIADLLPVDDVERAAFGLKPDTQFVALFYSQSGFVSMTELTADEYDGLRADYSAGDLT